jgi:hypothetical protein
MNRLSIWASRRSTLTLALIIAAGALLANLMLIVNPGFYSHDEWQRYDFITLHGVPAYLAKYWMVREGPTFATPVRPIGFIQQGLAALWMESSPWVPHLVSALLHALVAIALFITILITGLKRRVAVLAALLFCISPLGVLANGWTAASFDQWYVLFTLGSVSCTFLIIRRGVRVSFALALLCFSTAAMLSKETAMMLPAAVAGCGLLTNLFREERIQWRRIAVATAIAALPIGIYLLIRFPALQRSMASTAAATQYSPAFRNLLPNTLGYLEFPFIPKLTDMVSIVLVAHWVTHAALLMHALLLACLAWTGRWKVAVAYVFAYGIFLTPILLIPNTGSHYLYASSIAFSTALAWLLATRFERMKRVIVLFAVACIGVTTVHTYNMQAEIYADGACQMRFLSSLDTAMAARGTAHGGATAIEWRTGTPEYVASSAVFGRTQYRGVRFQPVPQNGNPDAGALLMGPDCRVSP